MTRLFGYVLLAALVCLILVSLIARAIDAEAQDRVIFTRSGVTLDCERRYVQAGKVIRYEDGSSRRARPGGEVAYTNCHLVP